jgi:hypothetical protein
MAMLRARVAALTLLATLLGLSLSPATAAEIDPRVKKATSKGLDWLADRQHRLGYWTAADRPYPVAMTSLSGMAMIAEGSTTTQGKYAENIRRAVDFLTSQSRKNGLIGDPLNDDRYTYGHGFAMLFLSQVLGEEEDDDRRAMLLDILARAVEFTILAQDPNGGWGYVSAKDNKGDDEGSTTITQVQGLRACRNAGIPVPKEPIDKAIAYIKNCTTPGGGVLYRPGHPGGARPPISAAAIACLFNAGAYDSEYVPKLFSFCKQAGELKPSSPYSGHFHYGHYYWSQVLYREGGRDWQNYRDAMNRRLVNDQAPDGSWGQSYVGAVYTTATNLTILQLEKATLPIYQR